MTPCLGSSIVGYQSRPVVSRLEKKLVRSLRISARFGKACQQRLPKSSPRRRRLASPSWSSNTFAGRRSEEHTSELQSPCNLVCRLLLEKKKDTWTVRHKRSCAVLLH